MTWLITGGAGYIGAHVLREFLAAGERVVVIDDLSTGVRERVPSSVPFIHGSILDVQLIEQTIRSHHVTGVVHIAGKKSVPESVAHPDFYEQENVEGTRRLLEACLRHGVRYFVFSSSAAVYGAVKSLAPIDEEAPTLPINPYGQTKLDAERLVETATTSGTLGAITFRYFNVGGAVEPLLEDSLSTNLIPIVRRAIETDKPVQVFGTTLPTRDGTCIRDYIHVQDLARAHLDGARYLENAGSTCYEVMNLGTGYGSTVLEVIRAIAAAFGREIPWVAAAPRPGDPVTSACDASKAERLLGWRATRGLSEIVARPQ